MTTNPHCLIGTSFTEFDQLQHVITTSSVLSQYKSCFENTIQYPNDIKNYTNYLGHDIPFTQIEDLFCKFKQKNIILITNKSINISYLKVDEVIMRRFPFFSFFIRNCKIDESGNQILLETPTTKILMVTLYKGCKDKLILPI